MRPPKANALLSMQEGREEGPGWGLASRLLIPPSLGLLAQDSLVHRRKSQCLQWQEEMVEESTTLKSERHGFKSCTWLDTFRDVIQPLRASVSSSA